VCDILKSIRSQSSVADRGNTHYMLCSLCDDASTLLAVVDVAPTSVFEIRQVSGGLQC
jgi:hypothetical protein